MSKQQTAVDYLVEQFAKYYSIHQLDEEIEQSKAMEKEQIIDAYWGGLNGSINDYSESKQVGSEIININYGKGAEQYFNETYESNGSDDHLPDVRKMVEISDEEITKLANEYILYNDSKRQWVIEGMKLYREQLKINNQ